VRTSIATGILIAVVLLMTQVRAADGPVKPPAASEWVKIEAGTGAMQLDGTLRLSWALGGPEELKALGLRLTLEHRIETDFQGRAKSAWRVTGLRGALVPDGREHLRWQPPAGPAVKFESAKIGRALGAAGAARWLIRVTAQGDYEIRAPEGGGWRYAHGALVSAEHPALGNLQFVTTGALVREIRQADAAVSAHPLVRASYDSAGRITELVWGAGAEQRLTWSEAGELQSWRRADGTEIGFGYEAGLLVEVREPGKAARRLAWAENPGHARGDSRWAAPVHLAADGEDAYGYALSAKGFTLRRDERATGRRTLTIFNPRRRWVEQRVGDETRRVWFRKSGAGGMALERIEDGAGTVLEAYRYDARGQLVGVRRKGEAESTLAYDESGRLMALESIATP